MDDVIAILEATDWDDPDDADWAFERLDYNPTVSDSVIGELTAVATNPNNDSEMREFAVRALGRTGLSYADFKSVCDAFMSVSPFLLKAAIWTELMRHRFGSSEKLGGQ